MSQNRRTLGALLVLWVLASGGTAEKPRQSRESVDQGIRIIKNRVSAISREGKGARPTFTEDLPIGDVAAGSDSSFGSLSAVLVDDDDNIIAFDGKTAGFIVFDKSGKLTKRFGRKGQGPGEIQTVMGMALVGGGNIAVIDSGNARMSVFSQDGTVVKAIPLSKGTPLDLVMDGRGQAYGSVLSFGREVFLKLVKFGPDLSPAVTLASLKMPPEKALPPAELMERYRYFAAPDGTFVWASNFRYALNVVNPAGKTTAIIELDAEPEKLTRAWLIAQAKKQYPNRPVPEAMAIPSHFPKNLPFFSGLFGDDEGRIYVRRLAGGNPGRTFYDVFDASGAYIARFDHPEDEEIVVIKRGHAYARIKEDEKGVPLIKRSRISW